MTFVIGVDGGGTHARAVLMDAGGEELARGEAPGAVVTLHSPEEAAEAVRGAVHAAAHAAGVSLPGAVLWAGLAGAGTEAARLAALQALSGEGLADRVIVGPDVEAAFHAAFPDGPGVLLIAGTGSVAWARDPDGRVVRAGGWGDRFGDEGSGYAIGVGALRAVARAEDGRGEPTVMREGMLEALELDEPGELISWAAAATKADVAMLVPVVTRADAVGDAAAAAVLDLAVRDLVTHLTAVLKRVGAWRGRAPLVVWGGLITRGGALRSRLLEALVSSPVELRMEEPDATMGAARLALATLRGASQERL
jgi:N-acetylglucosamine kinase-like BadF-type ATPase